MSLRFASWKVTRRTASESNMLSSEWEMRRDNMDSTCGNVKEKGMEEIDGGDSGNREFVFVFLVFCYVVKRGEIQA